MIDIHTHILPGVDDGSSSFEESIEMIKKEIEQGVTHIVLTPHVFSKEQDKTRAFHIKQFELLQDKVKDLNITLILGAEIYYRSHIDVNYDDFVFGDSNIILMEFSTSNFHDIESIVFDIQAQGYQVIVAHVERYQYLKKGDYQKIRNTGALLQVNASALLGISKYADKKTVNYLVKHQLIDIVATDTHHINHRPPNLLDAYNKLKKHYKTDDLELMFHRINMNLIKKVSAN